MSAEEAEPNDELFFGVVGDEAHVPVDTPTSARGECVVQEPQGQRPGAFVAPTALVEDQNHAVHDLVGVQCDFNLDGRLCVPIGVQ